LFYIGALRFAGAPSRSLKHGSQAANQMFSAFPEIMLTVCRVSSLQPVAFLAEKIFEPRRSHFSSVHYTDFQEDMPWISS
jgi:hypothetical protein